MVPGNTDSIQTYEVTPHDFVPIRLGSSAIAGIKPSITGITGINTGITGVSKTYPLKGPSGSLLEDALSGGCSGRILSRQRRHWFTGKPGVWPPWLVPHISQPVPGRLGG